MICRGADRVQVLRPGVRPEPLRWESRTQDTGPSATSSRNIKRRELSQRSPSQHHHPAPLNDQQAPVLDTLCQTTTETGTQPHPLAERLPKIIISSQTPQNTPPDMDLPTKRQDPASSTRTQAPVSSTRKPTQPTEPTLATKNNGNYEPAACEKKTPNTVT